MTDATRTAWGWGLATVHDSGRTLDTWFPSPALGEPDDGPAPARLAAGRDELRRVSTEVRRVVPITTQQGQHGYHVSRTWFAQGPRWLLRGVLMGEAGLAEGLKGSTELLYELFANTVVRRGDRPKVPGELIPMTMPPEVANRASGASAGTR